MTPIEWFALIVVVLMFVKGIVVLINPKAWIRFAKGLWKTPWLTGLISFVLAAVVLFYLLLELTIVEVFAVMLFVMLLGAVGVATYMKEFMSLADKISKRKVLSRSWFYWVIWLVLALWVVWVLFF
jgi:hypothetical protein